MKGKYFMGASGSNWNEARWKIKDVWCNAIEECDGNLQAAALLTQAHAIDNVAWALLNITHEIGNDAFLSAVGSMLRSSLIPDE